MFSSNPGLYPLDARTVCTHADTQTLLNFRWSAKSLLNESHFSLWGPVCSDGLP